MLRKFIRFWRQSPFNSLHRFLIGLFNPLGRDIPLVIGAILDALGNAVHAAMKIALINTTVLVAGCGPVGLMTIALAKRAGAQRIFATDPSDYRLDLARRMGAEVTLNPAHEDVKSLRNEARV